MLSQISACILYYSSRRSSSLLSMSLARVRNHSIFLALVPALDLILRGMYTCLRTSCRVYMGYRIKRAEKQEHKQQAAERIRSLTGK